MKGNLKYTASMALFLFCAFTAAGQDFKSDMLAINKRLSSLEKFSLTLHYRMFLDNKFDSAYQERDVQVVSYGRDAYCGEKNIELVSNKTYKLVIDHRMKQMFLTARSRKGIKAEEVLDFLDTKFDSLQQAFSRVDYRDINATDALYLCTLKNGRYEKMYIYFDKKTKQLNKVIYFFREPIQLRASDKKTHPVALEISYLNYKINPAMNDSRFSIDPYLSHLPKDEFKPAKKYQDYTVINKFKPAAYESK